MSLQNELDRCATAKDDPGAGDLILTILMKSHQELNPDADALILEKKVPALLRRKYGIPEGTHFHSVLRDEYIADSDRGTWSRDRFLDLVIMAFVLGATRVNLPPPHDRLVPFYRDTADKQDKILAKLAADCAVNTEDGGEFAKRIAQLQAEHARRKKALQEAGLDAETLERLQEAEDNRYRTLVLSAVENSING